MITIITQTIDWLVGISGLFAWMLFLPQIKLLIDVKKSESISLAMTWGSWIVQTLILIQSILNETWTLVFTMGVSMLFLTITNACIHYYRIFPGGRNH